MDQNVINESLKKAQSAMQSASDEMNRVYDIKDGVVEGTVGDENNHALVSIMNSLLALNNLTVAALAAQDIVVKEEQEQGF